MATEGGILERKRLVLMGTTGTGKSSLGNALLCLDIRCNSKEGFRMSAGTSGCTMQVEALDGYLLRDPTKRIRVIDTPGASDGAVDNDELRAVLVEGLKKEKSIHAFLWVKNYSNPRFDQQDKQFFSIFSDMFGKGFLKNLIVVFTRFSHSDESEQKRKELQGASLDDTIAGFRERLGDTKEEIPMLAIDAHYNKKNPLEEWYFAMACNELWAHILGLSAHPVEHVEAVKDKIDKLVDQIQRLTDQIESMRVDHARDKDDWEKKLQEALDRHVELETKVKKSDQWPGWFRGVAHGVPVVDNLANAMARFFRHS